MQDARYKMNHVSCIVNPASILKAKAIGYKALKSLSSSKKTARVHSVFDRGFYIQFSRNHLITVIKNSSYIAPSSILIELADNEGFNSIGIKEGMEVKIDKNSMIIGDGALIIKFNKSSVWFPPPLPDRDELISLGKIGLNLRILRDVIYTCPSREGLVPLLENVELYGPTQLFLKPQKPSFPETARPYIETLMWGLFGGDLNTVVSMSSQILGLGPGLTPSCDDFLTGLILSLNVCGKLLAQKKKNELGFYRKVSSEICRAAKVKTTIYSQNFLNAARAGECPKAVVELVLSLLSKHPNEVAVVSKTVINMGETSGADIAIGVYYGVRFLLSRLELSELEVSE
ncbi:MAG: DUF2877 domain-containing protein [Thermodesulfobacteriota bacterium]